MKDQLEKYVSDHLDDFNHMEEPSPELWARIEKTIHKKTVNWRGIIWKAASILIIAGLSYMVYDLTNINKKLLSVREKSQELEIPELKEAEMYYSQMVNTKLKEIQPILTKHPDINEEINQDLAELDSVYSELKNDLKDNVANHEVIEAMIQNYRLRLSILEDILNELKTNGKKEHDEYNEVNI